MATEAHAPLAPRTFEDAAAALAAAGAQRRPVRIVGSATKQGWGRPVAGDLAGAAVELHTSGLDEIIAHNAGDLTASLQAGVPVAVAQRTFAAAGQMLALDPPLGATPGATIGGVVATGDCGPLRHRYGAPRDLVVGATVALSDGTIARAGGTVIKNVAGYDLAKLFAGSFGTLGLILSVNVRLHPRPEHSATALGAAPDPARLTAAALALAAFPAEFECLDVAWRSGRGTVLARCAGPEAARRAYRTARRMRELGLAEIAVSDDDAPLWGRQRAAQRSADRALVRVTAPPTALAAVIAAARACGGALVGRAALGQSFVEVDPEAVARLRTGLPAGAAGVVLDAPPQLREAIDPWGPVPDAALALMRQVKARFDPSGTCNPGLFAGGI
jgi:glycolate oxidase FAD binding subunit